MKDNNVKGIVLMLISCIFASILMALVRYLSDYMHPFQIVFFRNFFAVFLFIPMFMKSGFGILKTSKMKLYCIRVAIGLTAMLIWFYSLSVVPLTIATSLSFMAPLLAVVFAVLFLGEQSDKHTWLALLMGFAGTIIVLRPGTDGFDMNALFVLAATVLWGIVVVIIKKLSTTEDPKVVAFYMTLMSTPISFIVAQFFWESVSLEVLGWLILLAFVSNVMQITLTTAFSIADITTVQPFDFTRLIFISIIAYYIFDEVIDIWTIIGSVIILASAVYAAYSKRLLIHSNPLDANE